ncbi:MAG TPA: hypothetical protein DDY52_02945 [Candidatus Moranbacteria bacterium]|nr:MAG: hypothetical protein UR51_C0008G0033 [Candidatus Moranbacteria bacterium GW2011_GWF1_34_10]HBI17081.1 hypothetical protein [Candidatus Moranbacteria bacterium]
MALHFNMNYKNSEGGIMVFQDVVLRKFFALALIVLLGYLFFLVRNFFVEKKYDREGKFSKYGSVLIFGLAVFVILN